MQHILCPVCSEQLSYSANHKSAQCQNGHLFDFAKQGYLNLLLVKQKKTKSPGDDTQMVQARSSFLDAGYYDIVSQFLAESVHTYLQNNNQLSETPIDFNYTDIACGEGYYTCRVDELLRNALKNASVSSNGIDISVPALKKAARRNQQILWLVASVVRLPIENNCQDLITGLFFHFDLKEVHRTLKDKGAFITFSTGPEHLIELRALLYDEIKSHKTPNFDIPEGLKHQGTQQLKKSVKLTTNTDILNLLKMTPHYWRTKPEKKATISQIDHLSVTVDIRADVFVKI